MPKRPFFPAIVAIVALVPVPARAQGSPSVPAPFKVLNSVGTPDEQSYLERVTGQLRTRSADAKFTKALEDAASRGDYTTARGLVAEVIGIKPTQVAMTTRKTLGLSGERPSMLRFASYGRTLNPWYLVFSVGARVYCASTSAQTCHDALHKMGYKDTEQIW
jgi:hypothetical protein